MARYRLASGIPTGLALLATIYHLVYTQYLIVSTQEHLNIHLMLVLLLVTLSRFFGFSGNRVGRLMWLLVALASLLGTLYVMLEFERLMFTVGHPTGIDQVVGWILLIVVFVVVWAEYGPVLPIIGAAAIAYAFLGPFIPGPLRGPEISAGRIISFLSIGVGYGGGLYGSLLTCSANYIFLFVLFGGLMGPTRVGESFREVGRWVGKRLKGGAALTAIVSSSLVGMVTGVPAANVAMTGVFTIPAMKSEGRPPAEAAAFEAAASTGGSILPPIMGASAFLMASMLGVPYIQVCIWAVTGAMLFYFTCVVQAQITGVKKNIIAQGSPDKKAIKAGGPLFVVSVSTLIGLMAVGHTPMFSIFWAILALVLLSMLRKSTRPNLQSLLGGVTRGAVEAGKVGVLCAMLGPLATTFTMTLLGIKLPGVIGEASGGNLFLGLGLTAVITTILSAGMPGPATFVISALIASPVLVRLGVPKETAYLLILYFSVFAAISPPVATASIVAAQIANTSFIKTGLQAIRVATAAYIVPFLFVFNPALMLKSVTSMGYILAFAGAALGLAAWSCVLHNFCLAKLGRVGITLAFIAAIGGFTYVIVESLIFLIMGAFSFIILILWQGKILKGPALTTNM